MFVASFDRVQKFIERKIKDLFLVVLYQIISNKINEGTIPNFSTFINYIPGALEFWWSIHELKGFVTKTKSLKIIP